MARLSGGGRRPVELRDDAPPEGLRLIGVAGVALGVLGRAVDGQIGIVIAGFGCFITLVGAGIFAILLARRLWRDD